MALAVAIFALVVVGALVAGAFFAGTQEQRVGENSRRLTQSFGAAEYGLTQVIEKWDPQVINRVRQYPLDSVAVPLPANIADTLTPDHTGIYGGYVYKLNGQVYLIDITARDKRSAGGIIGRPVDLNTPGFLSRYFRDEVRAGALPIYESRGD